MREPMSRYLISDQEHWKRYANEKLLEEIEAQLLLEEIEAQLLNTTGSTVTH